MNETPTRIVTLEMTARRANGAALATLVVASSLFLVIAPAHAHGPCGCLTPRSGPGGATVAIPKQYRVLKIVWNPHPRDFPPRSLMERDARRSYERSQKTVTLYQAPKITRGARFVVPKVAPGRYMVQIFDGAEGGSHYTWGFFTVTRRSALPRSGAPGLLWPAAAVAGLGLVFSIILLRPKQQVRRAR